MCDRRYKRVVTCMLLAAALPGVTAVAVAGGVANVATAATAKPAPVMVVAHDLTLEQAVARVQEKTHGKVLRAGSRQYGDATEYRIKVLMPDGHVRVIPVRSRQPVPHSRHTQPNSEETH